MGYFLDSAKSICKCFVGPYIALGSLCQIPTFWGLNLRFVDCHCESWPDWKLAPGTLRKLFILMLYFHSGDKYFLSIMLVMLLLARLINRQDVVFDD